MTVYRLTWDDYQGPRTLTGSASDVLGYAETSYLVDFGHMDDGSLDAVRPDLVWRLGWNEGQRNRFWLYADGKRTDVCVDEVNEPESGCDAPKDGRPCVGPGRFEVVTTLTSGAVAERHPACFNHGLAEVDRAVAAGSIARVELVDLKPHSAHHIAASATFAEVQS